LILNKSFDFWIKKSTFWYIFNFVFGHFSTQEMIFLRLFFFTSVGLFLYKEKLNCPTLRAYSLSQIFVLISYNRLKVILNKYYRIILFKKDMWLWLFSSRTRSSFLFFSYRYVRKYCCLEFHPYSNCIDFVLVRWWTNKWVLANIIINS